ncbi:hypothetical protein NP493_80g03000 [Ridgeia piscesae]|uniref:Uncharacterized protein n=1 Tax=Ridgeia piscesae TaxID=27915 RepID=A0AAD9P8Z2_RIDPI|nr:hypothetical protein NP493_80g03000 [Ridgeia piscesae]
MSANSSVYFEDRCDCFHYYVCHPVRKGWKAVRMSCPLCIMWSQKSHTCAVRNQTCLNEIAANNISEVVDGGWQNWSKWGECSEPCGRGEQVRSRSCDNPRPKNGGKQCDGPSIQRLPCSCDPKFDAAGECDRRMSANSSVYFEDRCDCFHYYVCHPVRKGWKAVRMSCPLCIMWSQKRHTCAVRNQTCAKEITAKTPSAPLKEITCVDFESGWNGMRATKGIYIAASNVGIKSHTKFGRSAYFNGFSATLKIPRFTWSYR